MSYKAGSINNEMKSDKELMLLISKGDKNAFAVLMQRHIAALLNFNRQYLSTEAEDIVQEAFIRLWNKAPEWQDKGISPKAWLMRVSYNLCIDTLRKQKTISLEDQQTTLVDPNVTIEQHVINRSDFQQKIQQLNALPERQRTAITLCAYHGLNNKQAAAVLDISIDALESLLARGRRKLKQLLKQQNNAELELNHDD